MFVFLEKFQKSSGGLLVAARRLMLFISVLPGEASLITQFWVSLMKGLAVEIDLPGDASIVGSIFRFSRFEAILISGIGVVIMNSRKGDD